MARKTPKQPAAVTEVAVDAVRIVPSDTVPLTKPGRIFVVKRGTLSVIAVGSNESEPMSYGDVPKGFSPPYAVRFVRATGTTADVAIA